MRKIIGIDIDGTINNFIEVFIKYFKNLTGETLTKEDIDSWYLADVISRKFGDKIDKNIVTTIYQNEEFLMELKLLENIKNTLEKVLKEDKFELKFVTALGKKELEPIRDKWLERELEDLNIEVVYETNKSKVKMNYLIDDAPHNLDDLSPIIGQDNCICIKHLYNETSKYIRVNDLEEGFKYIYKKEKMNY